MSDTCKIFVLIRPQCLPAAYLAGYLSFRSGSEYACNLILLIIKYMQYPHIPSLPN